MNVAIYLRVSKEDGSQDEANQAPDCLQLCEARGWHNPNIFAERASGADPNRPEWRRLLDLARRGRCQVIVVWALDRVGRNYRQTLEDVNRLHDHGCRLISVKESWLDTGNPYATPMLAMVAWIAEQERTRLIERTKAGIERARAKGIKIGRPLSWIDPVALAQLRAQGVTIPEISRRFKVSERTIANHLSRARAAKNGGGESAPDPGTGHRRGIEHPATAES